MKTSLILGFLVLFLPGIALANCLNVGEGESGKDLVLRRGDLLTVTLPANPSTGYSWYVACTPRDLLKQLGAVRREEARHRHVMVGVGGVQIWNFRAIERGKANLVFSYSRPWEHGVAPVRLIQWPVTISR